MLETLHDLGGSGVGLAAPQVHVSLQVVILKFLVKIMIINLLN